MRLHVISDLHLERKDWKPAHAAEADVVVIAGDIHRGLQGLQWARETYADTPIVYVPGNHEYHRHALPALHEEMRAWGAKRAIHLLQQDSVDIDGVRFYGATMWTDFLFFGDREAAARLAREEMSDYDRIRWEEDGRLLNPADTVALNRNVQEWLSAEAEAGRTHGAVIVTHHAPSQQCVRPERADEKMTACFVSHHDALVANTRAALWIYGHTHWNTDFHIGTVRVMSNQRGYPGEETNGFDERKVVEV